MTLPSQAQAITTEPIILVETSRALPLVGLTVSLKSGAAHEPEGKEGACRLMARLMRRTGGGLTPDLIETRIDSLGGSMGADVAHSTIAFHGAVIARSIEPFVDLLADVIGRPSLSEDELQRLKRETLAELIEARDNDRTLARRWFRRRLFQGHPYARPVGGTINSVERVEPQDVQSLYQSSLVRQNLVFGFAGHIDVEQAHAFAERLAFQLPQGHPVPDSVPDPVVAPGRRLVIVDKPDRTQTQILIGTLGTHPRDEDHIALHVGNTIFGGTFTARLMREVRSQRGWSYGAYSSLPYDRRRQAFSMWTFPKSSDAAGCIRLQIEMLEQWRNKGVTQKELGWAKRYLVRSHAFAVDTATKRVGLTLDELIYELPPGYYKSYIDRVRAVTLDQVNAAIAQRIATENLLVTVVGTESEIGSPVRDAIDGLGDVEVIPFDRAD